MPNKRMHRTVYRLWLLLRGQPAKSQAIHVRWSLALGWPDLPATCNDIFFEIMHWCKFILAMKILLSIFSITLVYVLLYLSLRYFSVLECVPERYPHNIYLRHPRIIFMDNFVDFNFTPMIRIEIIMNNGSLVRGTNKI